MVAYALAALISNCTAQLSSIGLVAAALNSQGRRQNGHFWSLLTVDSHLLMHCRWKEWLHLPHTTALSSPGNLASGGQPSKGALHIPQTSSPARRTHCVDYPSAGVNHLIWRSSACLRHKESQHKGVPAPQVQLATPCHFLMVTSKVIWTGSAGAQTASHCFIVTNRSYPLRLQGCAIAGEEGLSKLMACKIMYSSLSAFNLPCVPTVSVSLH